MERLTRNNAKVASLEKSLGTRSKEIAMQNARLSELEKLLAKTSAKPSPAKMTQAVKSSEELTSLKEENRVLMEAMDVLQRQVDGYENEIRFLKDTRSPKRPAITSPDVRRRATPERMRMTPTDKRRMIPQRNIGGPSSRSLMDEMQVVGSSGAVGAVEAVLFRPALHSALRDAAKWKGVAMKTTLLELPPLAVPVSSEEESKEALASSDAYDNWSQLTSALSHYRMEQASCKVVDLSNREKSSRAHLRQMKAEKAMVAQRLDEAAASLRGHLAQWGVSSPNYSPSQMVGKVKLSGSEPSRAVATTVTKDYLHRLNLHLLQ